MGLFSRLLLLPLEPVNGVVWLARRLEEIAEAELSGGPTVDARMQELRHRYEAGALNEDDYARAEAELLAEVMGEGHGREPQRDRG